MDDFYGTAAAFRQYHSDRGRDMTGYADDGIVGSALLVATEWLDHAYRCRFSGFKVNPSSQVREWPRSSAISFDGYPISNASVPLAVDYATYELALRQLQNPAVFNRDYTPSQYKRVSIEGAVSVDFATVSAADIQTQFPVIGQILAPVLMEPEGSGLSGRAFRA